MKWRAPKMWEGSECWIIGGGPSVPRQFSVPESVIADVMIGAAEASAYSPYLAPIRDKHIIGINNAYRIGSWIDVLFFGDCAWYMVHRLALREFPGLKVSCCPRFGGKPASDCEGVKYLAKDPNHRTGITTDAMKVAWNNNSGAAAISMAAHFGVKRIVLLGFDMALDSSRKSHWHGSHGGKKPPPFARHLLGFPDIAKDATQLGIEIINASPDSAIQDFPKKAAKELW